MIDPVTAFAAAQAAVKGIQAAIIKLFFYNFVS